MSKRRLPESHLNLRSTTSKRRTCDTRAHEMDQVPQAPRNTSEQEAAKLKERHENPTEEECKQDEEMVQSFLIPVLDKNSFGDCLKWSTEPAVFCLRWWEVQENEDKDWDSDTERGGSKSAEKYNKLYVSKEKLRAAIMKNSVIEPLGKYSGYWKYKIINLDYLRSFPPNEKGNQRNSRKSFSKSKKFQTKPRGTPPAVRNQINAGASTSQGHSNLVLVSSESYVAKDREYSSSDSNSDSELSECSSVESLVSADKENEVIHVAVNPVSECESETTPKKVRLLEDFLIPALDNQTYGHHLKWDEYEPDVFCINWTHQASSTWDTDASIVFIAWDAVKGRSGPKSREDFVESKQRLRSALRNMKVLTELGVINSYKRYRIEGLNPHRGRKGQGLFCDNVLFTRPSPKKSVGMSNKPWEASKVTKQSKKNLPVATITSSGSVPSGASEAMENDPEIRKMRIIGTPKRKSRVSQEAWATGLNVAVSINCDPVQRSS